MVIPMIPHKSAIGVGSHWFGYMALDWITWSQFGDKKVPKIPKKRTDMMMTFYPKYRAYVATMGTKLQLLSNIMAKAVPIPNPCCLDVV